MRLGWDELKSRTETLQPVGRGPDALATGPRPCKRFPRCAMSSFAVGGHHPKFGEPLRVRRHVLLRERDGEMSSPFLRKGGEPVLVTAEIGFNGRTSPADRKPGILGRGEPRGDKFTAGMVRVARYAAGHDLPPSSPGLADSIGCAADGPQSRSNRDRCGQDHPVRAEGILHAGEAWRLLVVRICSRLAS